MFFQKKKMSFLPRSIYCSGVLRSTSYNPTKLLVLRSTAVVCMCSPCVFAVQYVLAEQYVFAVCVLSIVCVRSTVVYVRITVCVRCMWGGVGKVWSRGRASLADVWSNKWRVSTWSCIFVLALDLGWVSALTAMPPFFAVRLHRGGKLCISDGGTLWAGKLAVLQRLHHGRQVPVVCGIVRSWLAGRCLFPCHRGSCK